LKISRSYNYFEKFQETDFRDGTKVWLKHHWIKCIEVNGDYLYIYIEK